MHTSPMAVPRAALLLLSWAMVLLWPTNAPAADVIWTGAVDHAWSNDANWDPLKPALTDVAVIPLTANQPEIDAAQTACAGIVLEEDATITVLDSGIPSMPNTLYLIGPGDLDGDGYSDIYERDLSALYDNLDADGDGIPNYAETDSDNDGASDACEIYYSPQLDPYGAEPGADYDHDGFTDAEECSASPPSDPTVTGSIPAAMPLLGSLGLLLLTLCIAVASAWILRKSTPGMRRFLVTLLALAACSSVGYLGFHTVFAATLNIDFATGQRIPEEVAAANAGDVLEIAGDSTRPWNGRSTYIVKPLTLKAVNGTVYLGGMQSPTLTGILGQGTLQLNSDYTGADHPSQTDKTLYGGATTLASFRGERFTFLATPEAGWGFHGWQNGASGDTNPLSFQVLSDGMQITALFGPPGPDLLISAPTGPDMVSYAGDSGSIEFTVTNIGMSITPETTWDDRLVLSRDATFDAADLVLAETTRTGSVGDGSSYIATFAATLPDVAPGHYHLLAIADIGRVATDENRNNNVAAVGITVLDVNLAQ